MTILASAWAVGNVGSFGYSVWNYILDIKGIIASIILYNLTLQWLFDNHNTLI